MMTPERELYLRDTGAYYGYPKCCVDSFIDRWKACDLTGYEYNPLTPYQEAVHHNHGFVPCDTHARSIFEGMETLESILLDRKHDKPFPHGKQF